MSNAHSWPHIHYLEVQATKQYHKFWPALYQEWFTKFPEAEPVESDPTDSEPESDPTDSEPESDVNEPDVGSKRKQSHKAKKLTKKVIYVIFLMICFC
jgi:hypothetical protein